MRSKPAPTTQFGGKRPRFSVRYAIAAYLKIDVAEVEDGYRYQPTRTPCPVYAVDNEYLTATSSAKPPKSGRIEGREWVWRHVRSPLTKIYGWHIWRAQ